VRRPSKLDRFYEAADQVVVTDRDSPPRLLFYGEDFLVEDLPVGTKVIFPPPGGRVPTSRPRSATPSTTRRAASRCTASSARG